MCVDVHEPGGDDRTVGIDLTPAPFVCCADQGDDSVSDGDVSRAWWAPGPVDDCPSA